MAVAEFPAELQNLDSLTVLLVAADEDLAKDLAPIRIILDSLYYTAK